MGREGQSRMSQGCHKAGRGRLLWAWPTLQRATRTLQEDVPKGEGVSPRDRGMPPRDRDLTGECPQGTGGCPRGTRTLEGVSPRDRGMSPGDRYLTGCPGAPAVAPRSALAAPAAPAAAPAPPAAAAAAPALPLGTAATSVSPPGWKRTPRPHPARGGQGSPCSTTLSPASSARWRLSATSSSPSEVTLASRLAWGQGTRGDSAGKRHPHPPPQLFICWQNPAAPLLRYHHVSPGCPRALVVLGACPPPLMSLKGLGTWIWGQSCRGGSA